MYNKKCIIFIKILKWTGIILLSIVLLSVLIVGGVRLIKANQLKITMENGIQESKYIVIGGIKQYIQIRGENKDNRIILVLHGGPGSQYSSTSYFWQTNLESKYTIVQWDQRGCGKTYFANMNEVTKPELSIDLMLSDLDELVNYLCEKYQKQKIVILGHSWGTLLGSYYVQNNPEKISAYIGVGQLVDTIESEKLKAEEAARLASLSGDQIAASDIIKMYDEFIPDENDDTNKDVNMKLLVQLAALEGKFLPTGDIMSASSQFSMGLFSPDMDMDSLKWYLLPITDFEAFVKSNISLYNWYFHDSGISMYERKTTYDVPMYYISGNLDWTTPYSLVKKYYETVEAPEKDMITISNVGHDVFNDKPAEFCEAVLKLLSQ